MLLSILKWHWIQNIEQKIKTKEIETWKIKKKKKKNENLVLPKE